MCTRFERLILALSSHAILKNTARTSSLRFSGTVSVTEREVRADATTPIASSPPASAAWRNILPFQNDLEKFPRAYTTHLAAAQSARLDWERAAAILVQRKIDLELIRVGDGRVRVVAAP